MKRPSWGRQHLDTRILLDYLDDRLDPRGRTRVEDHLAGPCSRCRELLHEAGRLAGAMRADRTPPVPATLRERALACFPGLEPRAPASSSAWRTARLVFDSLAEPLPAAVRRTVGEARWLRYELDAHRLEIEAELETPETMSLRGRLEGDDPALFRIEVEAGDESLSVWPDAAGRFALDGVPAERVRIAVTGPGGRWRLPFDPP